MPTLKAKCLAIARDLGIDGNVFQAGGAAAVLKAACSAMGIVPKQGQTLPDIADALVEAVGCEVDSTPAPAPPPQPPQLQSSKSAGKRKQPYASSASSSFPEAPSAAKQPKITAAPGIAKFFTPKVHRTAFAAAQDAGAAVSIEEMQEQIALEVVTLPSEKSPRPPPPKPVYKCPGCPKTFQRPCELAGQVLWKHPTQPRGTVCMPARQFRGKLSTSLACDPDGGVRLTIRINGKDRAQMLREAEENERAMEAAKAERERESSNRRDR